MATPLSPLAATDPVSELEHEIGCPLSSEATTATTTAPVALAPAQSFDYQSIAANDSVKSAIKGVVTANTNPDDDDGSEKV